MGQDVAAVGDLQRELHVLLDEQHAGPVARRVLPDHWQQPANDDGRQAEAHLVEHQQLRLAAERAGDSEHLLLAARQQPRLPAAQRAQRREVVERRVGLLNGPVAVKPEVLGHRQPEEDAAVVRHVRDAQPRPRGRRHPGQVGAVQPDRAASRLEQPGDGPQRRGLARAVGAEQRHDLPGAHGQRQVAHDRRRPVVGDAQPIEFEYRVGARHYAQLTLTGRYV